MNRWIGTIAKDLTQGAAAGIAATVPMSLAMKAAQRAGLVGKQPPRSITENALHAAGVPASSPTVKTISTANHFLIGASLGGVFAVLSRAMPPLRTGIGGAAFGLSVWGVSYEKLIPSLGLLPPASRDQPGRPLAVAAAHVVFGAALAGCLRALRR
ncbi:hypothetical protein IV500_08180 [Paeniglutamicibacter antarcticus]|uniref:DUF1440 domain-containing protein n=1 Tax=Arthrobacter terrae TaxID=2935737 RepID=A0A931CMT6_9MICC|nr:DUF6789 family protein [Arthrobacter terrae]MBG0739365.1 hypothetical protein [Arthrobacter terrae]